MDSGPMGFFYNEDVFRQAGVDATKIKTWDDYYEAAEKLKEIGAYIVADSGDGSFYDAMVLARRWSAVPHVGRRQNRDHRFGLGYPPAPNGSPNSGRK